MTANRAMAIAVAWHVVVALVALAHLVGWRPTLHAARRWLSLPLVSVAVTALLTDNVVNAGVFVIAAVILLMLTRRGQHRAVAMGPRWAFAVGLASLIFGGVYPHFLTADPIMYLAAAPLGVLPCPTLAATTGAALMGGGLGDRRWCFALATLGLFYGVFGVLRLGVALDIGLVAAALALSVLAMAMPRAEKRSAK